MSSEEDYFRDMMAHMGVTPKDRKQTAGPGGGEAQAPFDFEADERRQFLEAIDALSPPKQEDTYLAKPKKRAVEEVKIDPAERDLFLQAVANVNPRDKRGPERVEKPKPAKGIEWITLTKKATVVLDGELDLHGMVAEEAVTATASFIARHYARGDKLVAVITGKGLNSKGGKSVLRPAVLNWVHLMGERYVRACAFAPRTHGGEGTILVYLRN